MPRRYATGVMVVLALLAFAAGARGQEVRVTRLGVLGEAQPAERVGRGGADRVGGLHWIGDDDLIVHGDDGRGFFDDVLETDDGFDPATGEHLSRFVYRVAVRSGEVAWHHRFAGDGGRTSVSPAGRHVMVQLDVSGTEPVGPDTAIARVLDARTGETHAEVLQGELCEGVRRDPTDAVAYLAFGPRRGEAVAVFERSEEDARRGQRVDDEGQPLGETHGTRAYRYHWQRGRGVGRAFKTDPAPIAFDLAPGGALLGYVAPLDNVVCVYGVQAERDRVLAGEHRTGRDAGGLGEVALDAPFYSGIQISNTHAVVARDAPGGPGPAMVFVINLTNGQVEARIESPGAHLVFDVNFERERIVVSGSVKHLALYDFAGNELYFEEDVTPHRCRAVALSSNGRRVALGGGDNTVHVYEVRER